jgi:hypothetical protein
MGMPEIKKAVEDDDGNGDFKGHAEIFREYGDDPKADGAHDKALGIIGNLEPVMNKWKPDLKRPEWNKGLLLSVFPLDGGT